MEKLVIEGGTPLEGEVAISGSKNSALPALAACLLTAEPVILHRVPQVRDLRTMQNLLSHIGCSVERRDDGALVIQAEKITDPSAPYEVVKTMRASSLVLGPLLARTGRARVSMPGGCAIGARPIDLHIVGLERLGAKTYQEHGYIEAVAEKGLKGTLYHFERISVTGTEDVLMASTLADGETLIENAAREPEVVDLAELLTKMGAQIEGAGTSTIRVKGVAKLHGTEHTIIPDRIEAGTFVIAGAITGGKLRVSRCIPEHFAALTEKMVQAGAKIQQVGPECLEVEGVDRLRAVDMTTQEFPGFATDLQAQYMALMTQAEGISFITETIFENRFMHVQELARMGASIRIEGNRAMVAGKKQLTGAQVIASDLRASASLVLAALTAKGETTIDRVYHLDRGYETIERKLCAVGAQIRRMDE
jgi:UDP-N-acetylglucosamine 1-carboxyvinyltransferase